ncbi:MAG: carbamoyl-phosphate synthase domain-containing protein [Actinomycetaceae bacterium]|nr:carbamoyl-phosphate synthase domain-containing protein [Actinomycetaceae bacterium]
MKPALLITSDGHVFRGSAYGASGFVSGLVEIDSSVSDYQKSLEAATSSGKVVVFTTPHIGNVGVSANPALVASGIVVREAALRASNWQSQGELETALEDAGVVGIQEVDTRALVKLAIRDESLRVGIFSGGELPEVDIDAPLPKSIVEQMCDRVREAK